jgi:uncharacterized membrane protein HdeD (DUF308 family)
MANSTGNQRAAAMAAATRLRGGLADKLGHMWWSFLLKGLLAVGLGLYAVFNPGTTVRLLALGVGAFCLADGAAGLIGALASSERREYFFQSLLSLLIGALLVFFTGESLSAVRLIFGAWLLVTGIGNILASRGLEPEQPERSLLMTIGLIAGLGGLVLVLWPGATAAVIGWIIALVALLLGGLLIFLGLRFRRLGRRLNV